MTAFTRAHGPDDDAAGFRIAAGRGEGLERVMFVVGFLPNGDEGPVHLHEGDEILRVLGGELLIRVGDERRVCTAGDVAVIPPRVLHGFRALADTMLEVVAEYDIGTLFPVRDPDGRERLIEVYRRDLPWGRRPPDGRWTTDAELEAILRRVTAVV